MRLFENFRSQPLYVGNVVEVRSESEILGTLDENGALEALPFMPEMLRHSGSRHDKKNRVQGVLL